MTNVVPLLTRADDEEDWRRISQLLIRVRRVIQTKALADGKLRGRLGWQRLTMAAAIDDELDALDATVDEWIDRLTASRLRRELENKMTLDGWRKKAK